MKFRCLNCGVDYDGYGAYCNICLAAKTAREQALKDERQRQLDDITSSINRPDPYVSSERVALPRDQWTYTPTRTPEEIAQSRKQNQANFVIICTILAIMFIGGGVLWFRFLFG